MLPVIIELKIKDDSSLREKFLKLFLNLAVLTWRVRWSILALYLVNLPLTYFVEGGYYRDFDAATIFHFCFSVLARTQFIAIAFYAAEKLTGELTISK